MAAPASGTSPTGATGTIPSAQSADPWANDGQSDPHGPVLAPAATPASSSTPATARQVETPPSPPVEPSQDPWAEDTQPPAGQPAAEPPRAEPTSAGQAPPPEAVPAEAPPAAAAAGAASEAKPPEVESVPDRQPSAEPHKLTAADRRRAEEARLRRAEAKQAKQEQREKARAEAQQLAAQRAAEQQEWARHNVTARTLYDAYDANEVSADDQYKGRTLNVSGVIKSIDKDFMNNIIVRFSTGRFLETVDAYMLDEQKANAAALRKGQRIVLTCRIRGRVLRSPQLDQCHVNQ
jgi:hypothetical protein